MLIVNRENSDGDIVPSELLVTVSSQEELKDVIRDHGLGSMVKEGELRAPRITRVEDIADGATYNLIGGQNEAVRRHRTWTEVSDKVLEDEAVKAVLSDPKLPSLYGKLEEFHDYNGNSPKCLRTADGTEQEIDGLCVNGTTAVVVEAKHHAETKHIAMAKEKALHVARVAREGGIPLLAAIKHFVPLLAANCFSAHMRKQCEAAGVGVVAAAKVAASAMFDSIKTNADDEHLSSIKQMSIDDQGNADACPLMSINVQGIFLCAVLLPRYLYCVHPSHRLHSPPPHHPRRPWYLSSFSCISACVRCLF